MLSNSIGTTMEMWDLQIPDLTQHFRVLRYDTRGHGASDVPAGAYSFDRLGRDAIELLDASIRGASPPSWLRAMSSDFDSLSSVDDGQHRESQ